MAPIRGAVSPHASYSKSAGVTAPSTTRSNPSSATATQQSAATHRPVPEPAPVDIPPLPSPKPTGPLLRRGPPSLPGIGPDHQTLPPTYSDHRRRAGATP